MLASSRLLIRQLISCPGSGCIMNIIQFDFILNKSYKNVYVFCQLQFLERLKIRIGQENCISSRIVCEGSTEIERVFTSEFLACDQVSAWKCFLQILGQFGRGVSYRCFGKMKQHASTSTREKQHETERLYLVQKSERTHGFYEWLIWQLYVSTGLTRDTVMWSLCSFLVCLFSFVRDDAFARTAACFHVYRSASRVEQGFYFHPIPSVHPSAC